MQGKYYDHFLNAARQQHPLLSEVELRTKVNDLVAPIDPNMPSGHLCGAAVDVRLRLMINGKPILIDMTQRNRKIPLENESHYYDGNSDFVKTNSAGLNPTIKKLRHVLIKAMHDAGFENYRGEYWHFSAGDQQAAVYGCRRQACFGAVPLQLLPYEAAIISAGHNPATRFPHPIVA